MQNLVKGCAVNVKKGRKRNNGRAVEQEYQQGDFRREKPIAGNLAPV
jgi:hypothetical protein